MGRTPPRPRFAPFVLATLAALFAPAAAGNEAGSARFASLKAAEVNGRRGPSLEHAVEWRYRRPGLPVEIVAESGAWRRIRDPHGDETWVRGDLLSARPMAFVRARTVLRGRPSPGARAVAVLDPGVVAQVTGCRGAWRRVMLEGVVGWSRAEPLWGAPACGAS